MALRVQRAQVLLLVLRKGLILTTIGVALGLVGAAADARGMLLGITPLDPKTFMVSLMFGLKVTFASCVPAHRATKVDPMRALRSE